MKKIIYIDKFKVNMDIQGFYLCKVKQLRTTRAGELYLDLVLQDKTGEVGAKVWDRAEEFSGKFKKGDPLAVRGRVESYQDKLQVVIGRLNKVTPARYGRYGFKEEELVPTSPNDPAKMWADIGNIIKNIKNPYLKQLISDLYRGNKKMLMTLPASISRHYPYRSGYLEHILSLAKVGITLAKHYNADVDLLLAGIFLHAIGKVKELSDSLIPSFTDEGNFLGHTYLSRDMVREGTRKIENFPNDLLTKVEHLIATHEGIYDRRYSSKPKLKEALLLQHIDYLDTRVNLFEQIINEDVEEGDWTSLRNYFSVPLFKGKKK